MISGVKDIRGRMASVRDTQKITNAMYLIASAKLRRAREELSRTRPYFKALQEEIKRIFRTDSRVENRYFYPPAGEPKLEGTVGCLVVTADKGLAGASNQNIIKTTKELEDKFAGDVEFFCGRRIRAAVLSAPRYYGAEELSLYGAESHHAARAGDRDRSAGGV